MSRVPMFEFRIVPTLLDAETCWNYSIGHAAAYRDFGRYAPSLLVDPELDMFMVVAIAHSAGAVGGVRIAVRHNPAAQLPCEELIAALRASNPISCITARRPAELGGLWVQRCFRGSGIGRSLLVKALKFSVQTFGVDHVSAIVPSYLRVVFESLRFVVDDRFGSAGWFSYPQESCRSALMHCAAAAN